MWLLFFRRKFVSNTLHAGSGIHNSSAAWDAPEMDAVVQAELDFGAHVSRCQQFLVKAAKPNKKWNMSHSHVFSGDFRSFYMYPTASACSCKIDIIRIS